MYSFFTPAKFLPEGCGFQRYGLGHLLWLAAIGLFTAVLCHYGRKLSKARRLTLARVLAYTQVCLELVRDIYLIAAGGWKWNYLPLHPCSFTILFMALWAAKPSWRLGNILYGFGLVGALAALVFCDWTDQPLWQFQSVYSFQCHGMMVAYILMLLVCGDIRPQGNGMRDCVIYLCVAVPVTMAVNHLLPECNFFFTNTGSEGSPLEILIRLFGTPWWLIAYGALALVLLCLEFLPWKMQEKAAAAG